MLWEQKMKRDLIVKVCRTKADIVGDLLTKYQTQIFSNCGELFFQKQRMKKKSDFCFGFSNEKKSKVQFFEKNVWETGKIFESYTFTKQSSHHVLPFFVSFNVTAPCSWENNFFKVGYDSKISPFLSWCFFIFTANLKNKNKLLWDPMFKLHRTVEHIKS